MHKLDPPPVARRNLRVPSLLLLLQGSAHAWLASEPSILSFPEELLPQAILFGAGIISFLAGALMLFRRRSGWLMAMGIQGVLLSLGLWWRLQAPSPTLDILLGTSALLAFGLNSASLRRFFETEKS